MFKYAQTNLQLYSQLRACGYGSDEIARVTAAYEFATGLFSGQFRASGRPFLAHLVGTASILVQHKQPADAVLTGLLHATYRFGEFGNGRWGATPARRKALRALVGSRVEAMIHSYFRFEWAPWASGDVRARCEGLPEADRLVLIANLANELDESQDGGLAHGQDPEQSREIDRLPLCARIARAIAMDELAEELEASHQAMLEWSPPVGPAASRIWPYTLAPYSHRLRLVPFATKVRRAVAWRLRRLRAG